MKRPFSVTLLIIAVTVGFFILQNLSTMVFGTDLLLLAGAKINQAILQGQFWRLITPVFLHASILHIGFNMYALYSLGSVLERRFGVWPFLALYFIGALWGNTLSFLLTPNISLGASTAVFGLIAAQGVYIYKNRFLLGSAARPMLMNIAMVVLINLVLGLSPGIDNWGHVGGLLGGLFYAWFAGPSFGLQENNYGQNVIVREEKRPQLVLAGAIAIAAVFILLRFLL
jgi:rhomboid protease GluP